MTPKEQIEFNLRTDPVIPKGQEPTEMDYIRAIIKFLDDNKKWIT